MRRIAIMPPRHAPWRSIASIAYAEHEGVKRHAPPDQGERTTW